MDVRSPTRTVTPEPIFTAGSSLLVSSETRSECFASCFEAATVSAPWKPTSSAREMTPITLTRARCRLSSISAARTEATPMRSSQARPWMRPRRRAKSSSSQTANRGGGKAARREREGEESSSSNSCRPPARRRPKRAGMAPGISRTRTPGRKEVDGHPAEKAGVPAVLTQLADDLEAGVIEMRGQDERARVRARAETDEDVAEGIAGEMEAVFVAQLLDDGAHAGFVI